MTNAVVQHLSCPYCNNMLHAWCHLPHTQTGQETPTLIPHSLHVGMHELVPQGTLLACR